MATFLFSVLFFTLFHTDTWAALSVCNSSAPSQPSTYSMQQLGTFSDVGLNYVAATARCGNPVTVNLPPNAIPVTAYLYVEGQGGGEPAGTTPPDLTGTTATFNGHAISGAVPLGSPENFISYQSWDGARFAVPPGDISGIGAGPNQLFYNASFNLTNGYSCVSWTLVV
ncbi:MAG: hypothetical protein ACREL1_08345, partial [bacterium]